MLWLTLLAVAFHRGVVVWLGNQPLGMLTVPEIMFDAAVVLHGIARWRRRAGGVRPSGADPGLGSPIPSRLRLGWELFLATAIVSFAAHASGFGLTALARLGAVGCAVVWAARLVRAGRWTKLTVPLSLAMVVQSVIAVAQRIHGGPLGLAWLGERRSGFKPLGSRLLPAGTTVHTNTLALYGVAVAALVLAAHVDRLRCRDGDGGAYVGPTTSARRVELAGLVASGVCIGMTGSRTAAIAAALCVAAVLWSTQGRTGGRVVFGGLVVFVGTLGATAVLDVTVWMSRAESSGSTSLDQLGSGRMALVRQSLAVFRLSPVTGVGPGNYLVQVLTNPAITKYSGEGAPVHNVWLSILATYGLIGFAAFAYLTVLLIDAARRAGIIGAIVGLPALVTLALDVATSLSPGFLLLGVSLGAICGIAARERVDLPTPPDAAGAADDRCASSVPPSRSSPAPSSSPPSRHPVPARLA